MKKALLLACLLLPATLPAQTPATQDDEKSGRLPFWRAELPGGTYTVALRAITAVSVHEYVVDGAARVAEMTIDTTGRTVARFYFIEPGSAQSPFGIGQSTLDKAQEIAEQAIDRTGQGDIVWRAVVKNYPTTTHAGTVEYRLASRAELDRLFKSADTSFRQFRTKTEKITGSSSE